MLHRNRSQKKHRKSEINAVRDIRKIAFKCSRYQQGFVCESRLWQTSTDVDELCLDLGMLYNAAMNSFVPKVVISAEKSATMKSPRCMKMNSKDKQKRVDFNKVSRRVKFEVRKARLNHEIKIIEGSKRRPKCIFAYINDQTRCRDKIKSIKDSNGDLEMDKTVITNILNFKFQQAFNVFSATNIYGYLTKLDQFKAPGTDGIHPISRFL
ncbi:RNA-directed DNA polymerase from mobile element jockey-like [Brachionus plicatilis]|uniref:RNA-directed DNA polymerase from mobile element jockey-like n=1 Tax=Brachionus plicatilis TaxID=10195 RepID=A0A3M7PZ32_BRAPC|nr:RNA-directed DNA polymerase from mobile element jockey-like [Brachionus plicatilis]